MSAGWIFVLVLCAIGLLWLVIPPKQRYTALERRMDRAAIRAKELQDQGVPLEEAFEQSRKEFGLGEGFIRSSRKH